MEKKRQEILQNRLLPEIQEFKQKCKTILLATVDKKGQPNVSYAPFILTENGHYQILISTIAKHAVNLQEIPRVSFMLIEDEISSKQIFARRRLTFDANVKIIERHSSEWETGIAKLKERHGELIDNLAKLVDFKLFDLAPIQGLYVKGFGQAFVIDQENGLDILHLKEGHKEE